MSSGMRSLSVKYPNRIHPISISRRAASSTGFNENCYSIKDTYGDLLADPRTAAIVGKLMEGAAASRGDVAESVKDNPNLLRMMSRMTLESLLNSAGDAIKPEQIKGLNAALQKIRKPEVGKTCL